MEYKYISMKTKHTVQNILSLLETEEILERHLNETRNEIKAACHDIALHTPGVHRSPDMIIGISEADTDELVGGILAVTIGIAESLRLNAETKPQPPTPYPMSYYLKDVTA